ncbi:hypothetical protein RO865_17425 [Blautia faecis]|uniref:hypothetical protein n=1 Tax=Blautia faecis TaxID=871665 RepID=UPI0028A2F3B4|nr:hypothetical protein [Blautia faecis]MDT4370553.1 hypothetical protein [Blautia faecis]
MKYKLIDYYDVLGNEEDGYEVNNLCTCVTGIEIADDATDTDIINYLKSINFLSEKATTETVEFDGDDFYIELTEKETGYPLGRLEREM